MDLEQTINGLLSKNEQLEQENNLLKSVFNVVQENADLWRARMQGFNNDALEELPVCSFPGRHPSSLGPNTSNERQFRKDLQQTRLIHEQRTSSPVDFKSFLQTSVHTDTCEKAEIQSCQADFPLVVKGPYRLLGEIAYQLDRRILSHVFQSHRRLYGFTLLNFPEKIREVSTHPLTGKVDEGYLLHINQRYADLMERLNQLGYKIKLHPSFTEFIVNTYGILKERPSENGMETVDYNNSDFLRKLIMTTAPRKLQRDLLLVLTCLCDMAEKDGKPLLLW
ncbi:speriolin-like protein isoform X1 [Etheostoma spectabile]|uniref:speriolin-like protein isoform X1 n=1 Tax=Etheostoma spectabile TaxID=54343 RepID=UPI0013AFC34A|nr:speriolin-like protein isoform X1 [Etheostoma spectabile]XP_032375591.1 speriolin-like protein isoform X1 [Etheostoma spectabile]